MADITYEITEELGTVGDGNGIWTKELNMISWNNREAVFDLRPWTIDHERMGKGITMSKAEVIALRDLLCSLDLD